MAINWQPSADIETLIWRAQLLTDVRHFFAERDILEVETPILSQSAPTAPYLDSFTADYIPIGEASSRQAYYLQTSPEFAMKRLLADGSGPIYQLARVFRNGETGGHHSPEFTMLEWYRPGLSLNELIVEVDDFLQQILHTPPAIKRRYQQLFQQYLLIDIFTSSDEEIEHCAIEQITGLPADLQIDRDGWLELLMTHVIEFELEKLNVPVFVYDYPASQAQLAKVVKDNNGNAISARFELYVGGLELANGYDELLDANELQQRFEKDNQQRRSQGKSEMPIDKNLLAAMDYGLPECSGVALGIDRLIMLAMNKQTIQAVLSFGFEQS